MMDCKLKEEATESQWRSMIICLERTEVLWLRLRTTSDHKLFMGTGELLVARFRQPQIWGHLFACGGLSSFNFLSCLDRCMFVNSWQWK